MEPCPSSLAALLVVLACAAACGGSKSRARPGADAAGVTPPRLPLVAVADVDLPGNPVRFDYQDIDGARGRLVVAHMNDGAVDVVDLAHGALVKRLTGIPTARGVAVGGDRIFVTSSPNQLVIVDAAALREIARVPTGNAPDGVAWDGTDRIVAVSDQRDGAVSLVADAGMGARVAVPLGSETGNIVFDPARHSLWVTVVSISPAKNELVAIDPVAHAATLRIPLPGCEGAHGLRIHPDGLSALVACEDDDRLARVDLTGAHGLVLAETGAGPDVLAIDPGLGWVYVAAESGDLTVFDIGRPGLARLDKEHVGDHAHSVAVDPATHRVYVPLLAGPKGTPVLRILQPSTSRAG